MIEFTLNRNRNGKKDSCNSPLVCPIYINTQCES